QLYRLSPPRKQGSKDETDGETLWNRKPKTPPTTSFSLVFRDLFSRANGVSLQTRTQASPLHIVRHPSSTELMTVPQWLGGKKDSELDPLLHPLGQHTFSVIRHDGLLEIELPFGVPQRVNARTLKALLGAHPNEILFRKSDKSGDSWEICPHELEIDLQDASKAFKLREVAIFS
ncbi:MAG: hypothetical protein L0312_03560, partial [Acidobacteria bacterium]|nr:hypothetical protein [Acidobacteriota bacterium]